MPKAGTVEADNLQALSSTLFRCTEAPVPRVRLNPLMQQEKPFLGFSLLFDELETGQLIEPSVAPGTGWGCEIKSAAQMNVC